LYGLGPAFFDQIPPTIPAGLASTVRMPHRLVIIPSKIGNKTHHEAGGQGLVAVSAE
jgi:hypothetical protein